MANPFRRLARRLCGHTPAELANYERDVARLRKQVGKVRRKREGKR